MGRKSARAGVSAIGQRRIRFDFKLDGVRYRPSLVRSPSETNLRQAREYLAGIKQRIEAGTLATATIRSSTTRRCR